eukprot:SAG22_NODE_61_length_23387_cov_34.380582_6_plen_260_part_00
MSGALRVTTQCAARTTAIGTAFCLTDPGLCRPLTDLPSSSFRVGTGAKSETKECTVAEYHWFGDEQQAKFMLIDTPGLNDSEGGDELHIKKIVDTMKRLDYVSAIVLVLNGTDPRFSQSLQVRAAVGRPTAPAETSDVCLQLLNARCRRPCSPSSRRSSQATPAVRCPPARPSVPDFANWDSTSPVHCHLTWCPNLPFRNSRRPQRPREFLRQPGGLLPAVEARRRVGQGPGRGRNNRGFHPAELSRAVPAGMGGPGIC